MSWLIPNEKPQYRYTKTRFIDREFGVEYTKFENEQMRHFSEERKKSVVEVTGYVSWVDARQFLLLPTKTVNSIYFICEVSEGIEFPDNNQYVSCKGTWRYSLQSKKSAFGYPILVVEEIQKSQPDFGMIKPDITHKDFVEILFERWINVDEKTQNLIAQTLVSSPTMQDRAGGLTLSLFNLAKERTTDIFRADMKRFIPLEIRRDKPLVFNVRELGIKHALPSFGWSDYASNFNSIPSEINNKLSRIPISNDEYSISLFSDNNAPHDFNSEGLTKSDYPIILEEHLERKSGSYYTDPEIFKFFISAHMSFPSVSKEIYQQSIEYSRKEILKKISNDEILAKYSGGNQLLDLGMHGRPTSILNLATSYCRSDFTDSLSLDHIKNTTELYLDNISYVTDVWKELLPDKIDPLSSLSNSERRVLAFLIENGPSSIDDGTSKMKTSREEFSRIMVSLYNKHVIYEFDETKYASIQN